MFEKILKLLITPEKNENMNNMINNLSIKFNLILKNSLPKKIIEHIVIKIVLIFIAKFPAIKLKGIKEISKFIRYLNSKYLGIFKII